MVTCGLCGTRLADGIGHVCTHYMLPTNPKADSEVARLMSARSATVVRRKLVPKPDWFDILARNLAIGAFGCKAERFGYQRGVHDAWSLMDDDKIEAWRSGCHRPAPGTGSGESR